MTRSRAFRIAVVIAGASAIAALFGMPHSAELLLLGLVLIIVTGTRRRTPPDVDVHAPVDPGTSFGTTLGSLGVSETDAGAHASTTTVDAGFDSPDGGAGD